MIFPRTSSTVILIFENLHYYQSNGKNYYIWYWRIQGVARYAPVPRGSKCFHYHPHSKANEGYVLTGVCHSFYPQGRSAFGEGVCLLKWGLPSEGGVCLLGVGLPSEGDLPLGVGGGLPSEENPGSTTDSE